MKSPLASTTSSRQDLTLLQALTTDSLSKLANTPIIELMRDCTVLLGDLLEFLSATPNTKKSSGFSSGELWGHTYPQELRNLVKIFKNFLEPPRIPLDGSKSSKLIENSSKELN